MNDKEMVRLWTFQPLAIYEQAMSQGVAYCTEEGSMSKDWPWSYKYMMKQMYQRIGAPEVEGVKFPLWAWLYYNGINKPKPRIVPGNMGFEEGPQVFIELLLPKSRILASDFTLWHMVFYDDSIDIGDNKPKEETWSRIFDTEFTHPDWQTRPWEQRCIQATFWCLFKEDIVSAILVQKQEGKKALLKKKVYTNPRKRT